MMEVQKFPKWKYHEEFEPVVAQDEQHEKKLGSGWKDSPAEFGIETAPPIGGVKPKAKAKK